MKEILLRPHHGMCMAFFVGEGYSDGFTAHMARTIALLEQGGMVRLVSQTDEICRFCPNNRAGVCATPEKVDRYDAAVLRLCGLEVGAVMPYEVFRALVRQQILQPGLRERICGDCQWNDLCKSL